MFDTSILFSEYRRRVLALLLLHPDERYHVREIARLTNTTAGTLHRELSKLAKSKVLLREQSGNQVYYQANRNFPIYMELTSILKKTSGLVDVLFDFLTPLAEKIEVAFVFGSVAKGTENLGSDIDVLIIGEVDFTEAVEALYAAQASLGREINPKIYSREQWKASLQKQDLFIQEVLNNPKLFIMGAEHDLG
ncbi:TPA: nucleotidyltransferase domain-containing protein [Legionella pneumophila]|uniref:nucleotidyltransferase domain-containing protein n=1 Tax=Legionella pneumophila TaxID=446 RepID=UPI0010113B42|nr:nucleotidyltransferase domain-containing protein [Legionella pneumophila]MCW8407248.1 nucleotidyltransferase domain-containing protein [Legionella pneumophila]MDW9045301.1 nucleotidyltransferase domain-containing protein [Legionella pneumophila]MDW9054563.1 nucleotidyltransferase domain-containing protein [Legionella pneumophila]MDW9057809.1 nucleotidyltransferase domain-containing protein [Legionella pneumophila]MDW9103073.1 nucleotidyltransferase domain-containing protein [Legionella pneu